METLAPELQASIAARMWDRCDPSSLDIEWKYARKHQGDLARLARVSRTLSAVAREELDNVVLLDGNSGVADERALDRLRDGRGAHSGRLVVITKRMPGTMLMPRLRALLALCAVPPVEYLGVAPYSEDGVTAAPSLAGVEIVHVRRLSNALLAGLTAARAVRGAIWEGDNEAAGRLRSATDEATAAAVERAHLPRLRTLDIGAPWGSYSRVPIVDKCACLRSLSMWCVELTDLSAIFATHLAALVQLDLLWWTTRLSFGGTIADAAAAAAERWPASIEHATIRLVRETGSADLQVEQLVALMQALHARCVGPARDMRLASLHLRIGQLTREGQLPLSAHIWRSLCELERAFQDCGVECEID